MKIPLKGQGFLAVLGLLKRVQKFRKFVEPSETGIKQSLGKRAKFGKVVPSETGVKVSRYSLSELQRVKWLGHVSTPIPRVQRRDGP